MKIFDCSGRRESDTNLYKKKDKWRNQLAKAAQ